MLHLLDDTIEAHLRKVVPLDKSIAVSFAIPDREWSTGLTRPTVNAHLWDIRREDKRSVGGVELVNEGDKKTRRLTLPRIRVSYFITTWTGDLRDEHVLLGRLLQGLLRSRRLDPDVIPPEFSSLGAPLEISVGASETSVAREFWGAIDGRYRPGIDLQIVMPVDVGLGTQAGPPTEVIDVRTSDVNQPTRQSERVRSYVEERPNGSSSG